MAEVPLGVLNATAPSLFAIDSLLDDLDVVFLSGRNSIKINLSRTLVPLLLAVLPLGTLTTTACVARHLHLLRAMVPALLRATIIERS